MISKINMSTVSADELRYQDKIIFFEEERIEAHYIGYDPTTGNLLVAIKKPNYISNNAINNYRNFGYNMPFKKTTDMDFPNSDYSFWAINPKSIERLVSKASNIYSLTNLLSQLQNEIKQNP